MKKILTLSLIFSLNIFCIYYATKNNINKYNYQNNENNVLGIKYQIKMSAFVGKGKFSLFGYGPANSLVTLSGIGFYEQIYSEENGYFEFKNQYIPIVFSEPCLTAQDHLGRLTSPVCIPSIPEGYESNIGPVLLPPSISLDKSDYFKEDDVVISGQAIPGSKINLSMFNDKLSSRLSMGVYAFSLPKFEIDTEKNGDYSIKLPYAQVESFRTFVQSNFNNDLTPKSNTLRIKILPFWILFVKFLIYMWESFKQKIIEVVIFSQIIALIVYLIKYYFHPHKIAVQRAIVLRQKSPLMIVND